MYACTDPFYVIQFMHILGSEYVVWDKSANIKFKRPVKSTVYARFLITDEILQKVNDKLHENGFYNINLPANLVDEKGVVYAEIMKTIYISTKESYIKRNKQK